MKKNELLKSAKSLVLDSHDVLAVLNGNKTSIRKVIKDVDGLKCIGNQKDFKTVIFGTHFDGATIHDYKAKQVPYQVDDILYVKETLEIIERCLGESYDTEEYCVPATRDYFYTGMHVKYIPSSLMKKGDARIFLKVTNIRVEKLQDIDEPSACKEGIVVDESKVKELLKLDVNTTYAIPPYIKAFAERWDSKIKKQNLDKYGWEANPYVFVFDFELVKCEEEEIHD